MFSTQAFHTFVIGFAFHRSDMAYVINMGDKPSIKFQHFVDLCCKAFNIVRKHGDLLLHMLALMATSGIPGVTADAVTYVRNALLPGQSNPEAAASFAKLIHISLKSWFTQFNFFLHNLAQMRFTGEECNGELLSFVPRTYTLVESLLSERGVSIYLTSQLNFLLNFTEWHKMVDSNR